MSTKDIWRTFKILNLVKANLKKTLLSKKDKKEPTRTELLENLIEREELLKKNISEEMSKEGITQGKVTTELSKKMGIRIMLSEKKAMEVHKEATIMEEVSNSNKMMVINKEEAILDRKVKVSSRDKTKIE